MKSMNRILIANLHGEDYLEVGYTNVQGKYCPTDRVSPGGFCAVNLDVGSVVTLKRVSSKPKGKL